MSIFLKGPWLLGMPCFYIKAWALFSILLAGSHPRAHPGHKQQIIKISAQADDTAVHLGTLVDVKIYKLHLRQYTRKELGKSEGVLCGKWVINPPNLGISWSRPPNILEILRVMT
jgi:hypothetical protein